MGPLNIGGARASGPPGIDAYEEEGVGRGQYNIFRLEILLYY
jgi:hypothetical protein